MLLTDDGLLDEWAIINSKYKVHTKHLPSHVRRVHFHSDGSAWFNSTLQRAVQPMWEAWTGVKEDML